MATTKFKGQPVKVIGEFIKVGSVAPDFELVKTDLSSFSLKELNGKNVIYIYCKYRTYFEIIKKRYDLT